MYLQLVCICIARVCVCVCVCVCVYVCWVTGTCWTHNAGCFNSVFFSHQKERKRKLNSLTFFMVSFTARLKGTLAYFKFTRQTWAIDIVFSHHLLSFSFSFLSSVRVHKGCLQTQNYDDNNNDNSNTVTTIVIITPFTLEAINLFFSSLPSFHFSFLRHCNFPFHHPTSLPLPSFIS